MTAESLSTRVKRELTRQILAGELRPGSVVSVRSVSADLGVGLTPTRDALLALRQEGLIEVRPNVGSVVRLLTADEIKARYELRLAIESIALRWAVKHITPTVHRRLLELCDEQERMARRGDHQSRFEADMKYHRLLVATAANQEISRAARHLRILESTYPMGVGHSLEQLLANIEEHRRIADLLLEGRIADAEAILKTHLSRPVPEAQARCEDLLLLAKMEEGGY